jgi:predicted ATP-grasp superfamily ATP-dependent carboligase/protein-tyrosine phosphatase
MRSLVRAGYLVDAAAPWSTWNYNLYSKCLNRRFVYSPFQEDPVKFQEFVLQMSDRYDVILPIAEDTELFVARIRNLLNKSCLVPIPDTSSLEVAMNKQLTISVAKKCGVPVPETFVPHDAEELRGLTLTFPAIVKLESESNVTVFPRYQIVRTRETLIDAYTHFAKFGSPLVQEYVRGKGIGAFYLYNKHSEALGAFSHRRIIEYPIQGGFSAIAESSLDADALSYALRLFNFLSWKGVGMAEFKKKADGSLSLMEINPRFWGSISLAVFSGIDFPKLLIERYNEEGESSPIKFPAYTKKNMVRASVLAKSVKQALGEARFDIPKSAASVILKGPGATKFEDIGSDMGPLYSQIYIAMSDRIATRVAKLRRAFYQRIRRPNLSMITDQLAVGGVNSVSKLADMGFGFIVDLRDSGETAEKREAEEKAIAYMNSPTEENHAPSQQDLLMISKRIDFEIEKGRKVLIHCSEGRGRAPTVASAYLMTKGYGLREAFELIKSRRSFASLSREQLASLEEFSSSTRQRAVDASIV